MTRLQVLFIKRTNEKEPSKQISHIGGKCGNRYWRHSMREAASLYRNGTIRYYINIDDCAVDLFLKVAKGEEYLITKLDGAQPDTLLRLPDFKNKSGNYMTVDNLLALQKPENNPPQNVQNNSIAINIEKEPDCEIEIKSGADIIKEILERKSTIQFPELAINIPQPKNNLKRISKRKAELKRKSLIEIWCKNKKDIYYKCIEVLSADHDDDDIKHRFLKQEDGKLYWSQHRGMQTYLACFIFACIEKKWIDDKELTTPIIKAICQNTFNVQNLDKDVFRKVFTVLPADKLLIISTLLEKV